MENIDKLAKKIASSSKLPIYMDYQSTTPLDPRVLDAMMPYMTNVYGNPHSRSHKFGWDAEEGVEKAREHIASLIGASAKEIIFTSGATEANNAAIKGVARFYGDSRNHIITAATEHKCVLDTCRHLQQEGVEVTYLPVGKDGLIDLDQLKAAITDKTLLVSIMAVNNEIGVIQPVKEIGKICRENKIFFHSDIAQGFGKIPLNMDQCNIDLASISAHKIYGPKGIGALYIRRRPRVRIKPLINGGGQERGLRSGTLSPALAVGFGHAAKIAADEMDAELARTQAIFDKMVDALTGSVPNVELNGSRQHRYPGNINLSFAYIEGESMIIAIKDLAVSSGSACTSASLEPSYVLRACGASDEQAHTSIRFGIGRFTTEQEIDYAIDLIKKKIDRLRKMSPLWEMVQEGIDLSKIEWTQH